MGASWFQISKYGRSAKEAYIEAVHEAEQEHGHDSYNGTISTTHSFEDLTNNFKKSGKLLAEYIDMQMDKLGKRECAAICLGEPIPNKNKIKSQVEHIITPGTKKWVLRYVAYNYHGDQIADFETKGGAVEFARSRVENTQEVILIKMEKVLEKYDSRVAIVTYKKSSTEKSGRWIFFGYAAE